jgi:hypoxanthine phosphoribosyltransferase
MEVIKRISEAELDERTAALTSLIETDIAGRETVLVANLKGSVVFFSDLIRKLKRTDVEIDFVSVRSYEGNESTGMVRIERDLNLNVRGKTVVLVEDIVDTGLTLSSLIRYIKEKHQPFQVKVCVLLDKPARRKTEVQVDYSGFLVGDEFLVGYGLDYNEHYRNLPYIGVLTGL